MKGLRDASGLAVLALIAVGCQAGIPVGDASTIGKASVQKKDFKPQAPAGLPVTAPAADEKKFKQLVASRSARFGYSTNPFGAFQLMPNERKYDRDQEVERLFTVSGSWSTEFTPSTQDQAQTAPVIVEPQPYRRLAGVVVGDSVLAIIDMGDGRPAEIIRPGQKIPNSPWRVVSIDENKAVLARSGNVQPRQIVVKLEPPPGGTVNTGGTPGRGGAPGGFPGGFPGGPPGGFPGGGFRPGGAGGGGAGAGD